MLFDLLRVASRVSQDMELRTNLQLNGQQQQQQQPQERQLNYNGRSRRIKSQRSKHQARVSRPHHHQLQPQPQLNLNLNFDLNFNISGQPEHNLIASTTAPGATQNKPLDLSVRSKDPSDPPPVELLAGHEARLRLETVSSEQLERDLRSFAQHGLPISSSSSPSSLSSASSSSSHSGSSEVISSTNPSTQADRDRPNDDQQASKTTGQKLKKQKSSTKSHLCNQCGRCFSRSDMLTRHSRLHSGLKPYQCGKCKQVFSRSDHLSTHERTHTGEKPYQCQFCAYSACRRDMITRHMRTHKRDQHQYQAARKRSNNAKKNHRSTAVDIERLQTDGDT